MNGAPELRGNDRSSPSRPPLSSSPSPAIRSFIFPKRQLITVDPTTLNSGIGVRKVSARVKGTEIFLAVHTGVAIPARCPAVQLGKLAAGEYQLWYRGADPEPHRLERVLAGRLLRADAGGIYLASLSVLEREALWRRRFVKGGGPTVLVAERAAEIGGWTVYGASRDADAGDAVGELHALNVLPAAWRKGFGTALGAAALDGLAAAGFVEATLWVLAGNERARRLYEALGFHAEAGSTRDYHGQGFVLPELRYRHPLQSP